MNAKSPALKYCMLVALVTFVGCETTPRTNKASDVSAAIQAGETVQVSPRMQTVEPFVVLDAMPATICEMGASRRFLVGTVDDDSIRILDDEGTVAAFHEFDDHPGPTTSAWRGDRYSMGFAEHGRILVGDLAGAQQFIETPATRINAITLGRMGELVAIGAQSAETSARSHAMYVLDQKGVRRIVPLYFEPTGVTAGLNGNMLISDASSIYRVTPAGTITRVFRGLDQPTLLTRLNATTILLAETLASRKPFDARIVALDLKLGRRTTIVDGLTSVGGMTITSDGTLWFTEPGNADQFAAAIYRMDSKQVAAALDGSTVWTVPTSAERADAE